MCRYFKLDEYRILNIFLYNRFFSKILHYWRCIDIRWKIILKLLAYNNINISTYETKEEKKRETETISFRKIFFTGYFFIQLLFSASLKLILEVLLASVYRIIDLVAFIRYSKMWVFRWEDEAKRKFEINLLFATCE